MYFIAFDHEGCFSFNQYVGKIKFSAMKDMFSGSKNVLEKLLFLALMWGLPIKTGQEQTMELYAENERSVGHI